MLEVYEIERSKCAGWKKADNVPERDPEGNKRQSHIIDIYKDMKALGALNDETMAALSTVAESINVKWIAYCPDY